MSSRGSNDGEEENDREVETIMKAQSLPSSPEPSEWTSLEFIPPIDNVKVLAYLDGKYHPGSGEVCAKYLTQSSSSVHRHVYYKYPAVTDPGIEETLTKSPPNVIYGEEGRDLYFDICKEMNQCPVRLFYDSLMNKEIDLSYYCVNPAGIRAMAIALEMNIYVSVLNLTENFLNDDACFHLGDLLSKNNSLAELNLSGCRIGPSGVKRIMAGLLRNKSLQTLNLNRNELGDEGGVIIADSYENGASVPELYLSYNQLGSITASAFAEKMEYNNNLRKLDLSWNNFISPKEFCRYLNLLSADLRLEWLDLSWNNISGEIIAAPIKKIMACPKLTYFNLSNNKIDDTFVKKIAFVIPKAKKLATLDLSNNPITPSGAVYVLSRLSFRGSGMKNLLMENVLVNDVFIENLKKIKSLKFRSGLTVTAGAHTKTFIPVGPDLREVIMRRMDLLCKKNKKKKVNFALFTLQLAKDRGANVDLKTFGDLLKEAGASVDAEVISQLGTIFPGPIVQKERTIDLVKMVEYVHRKWPDVALPPTPEPEPEPEPLPPPPQKGKGKSKKVDRGAGDASSRK